MMSQQVSQSQEELFRRLSYYSIESVLIDPVLRTMHISFVSTVEQEDDIVLKLARPILIKISKLPEDEELFLVGEIKLRILEDDRVLVLNELQFGFKLTDEVSVSDLPTRLYHFHLEGHMCLDVVCVAFSISRQVK